MKNSLLAFAASASILLTECSKTAQNVSSQIHTVQIHDVGVLGSAETLEAYLQGTKVDNLVLDLRIDELAIQIQRYKILVGDTFWEKDLSNILRLLDEVDKRKGAASTEGVRKLLTKDLKS